MEFERWPVTMEILDPRLGFRPVQLRSEQRRDPLTGQGCRLLPPCGLFPPAEEDFGEEAARGAADCPFCGDRIAQTTPRFPPQVCPDGRFRQGEAVLFPNLHAYARHSSVAVFSPSRHVLPLAEMTPPLVTDNLSTQVAFARAVTEQDAQARWVSVNANHLPPSGSSVLHPHTQGSAHPYPTTTQRVLAGLPAALLAQYVTAERAAGSRFLGNTGTVDWLASFAPIGPAELRAVLAGVRSPEQLTRDRLTELGHGIAVALNFYAELGFTSYNLALYGAPDDGDTRSMLLRMVCRSNPRPWYRSDVMWMERLHADAAVDLWPEDVAERAGDRFRR